MTTRKARRENLVGMAYNCFRKKREKETQANARFSAFRGQRGGGFDGRI
jgi:hypothetical protein